MYSGRAFRAFVLRNDSLNLFFSVLCVSAFFFALPVAFHSGFHFSFSLSLCICIYVQINMCTYTGALMSCLCLSSFFFVCCCFFFLWLAANYFFFFTWMSDNKTKKKKWEISSTIKCMACLAEFFFYFSWSRYRWHYPILFFFCFKSRLRDLSEQVK